VSRPPTRSAAVRPLPEGFRVIAPALTRTRRSGGIPGSSCCGRHAGVCRLPTRRHRLLLVRRSSSTAPSPTANRERVAEMWPTVRERSRRPNGHAFQSGFSPEPPRFRGKAGNPSPTGCSRKPVFWRTFSGRSRYHLLLAMQKVEGSNPFSRSGKACICRPFSWTQSAGASASPDNDWTIVSAATRIRARKLLFSRRFRATST
jgi:hypothetical protein